MWNYRNALPLFFCTVKGEWSKWLLFQWLYLPCRPLGHHPAFEEKESRRYGPWSCMPMVIASMQDKHQMSPFFIFEFHFFSLLSFFNVKPFHGFWLLQNYYWRPKSESNMYKKFIQYGVFTISLNVYINIQKIKNL